ICKRNFVVEFTIVPIGYAFYKISGGADSHLHAGSCNFCCLASFLSEKINSDLSEQAFFL
ncbi:MAG: hypothetical protein RRY34_01835, partial [Victivallaceae bacterium]